MTLASSFTNSSLARSLTLSSQNSLGAIDIEEQDLVDKLTAVYAWHCDQAQSHQVERDLRRSSDIAPFTEVERGTWSWSRVAVAKVIHNQLFEKSMGIVILVNFALIIFETNERARCYPDFYSNLEDCPYNKTLWVELVNLAMLFVYFVEVAARFYVQRGKFFKISWNILDAVLLSVDVIGLVLGGLVQMAFLKVFRTLRLVRALRLYIAFRELYLIINGFMGAMKAIGWGCIMLAVFVTMWSIILVEFIHPINSQIEYNDDLCPHCYDSYSTVYHSDVTLFQTIVAGDGWSTHTQQIIAHEPLTCVAFVGVVVSISLGLMNLILAVIVQRASESHQADKMHRATEKVAEKLKLFSSLVKMCEEVDENSDGMLSLEEFRQAWQEHSMLRDIFTVLDIEEKELDLVFGYLDENRSGDVSYIEMCEQIYKLQHRDPKTLLMFLRLLLSELKHDLDDVRNVQLVKQTRMIEALVEETRELRRRLQEPVFCNDFDTSGRRGESSDRCKADATLLVEQEQHIAEDTALGVGDGFDELLRQAKYRFAKDVCFDMLSRVEEWSSKLVQELRSQSPRVSRDGSSRGSANFTPSGGRSRSRERFVVDEVGRTEAAQPLTCRGCNDAAGGCEHHGRRGPLPRPPSPGLKSSPRSPRPPPDYPASGS